MSRQPVQMTLQGAVRCCFCRTDYNDYALPPDDSNPISEVHFGVRFPMTLAGMNSVWKARVLFNGDDVTAQCFEGEAGDKGWVALYALNRKGERFICGNGEHPLAYMEHGKVQFLKIPNDPAADSAAPIE